MRDSKDGSNSPLHLVSAYATSLELSLGQEGSAGKGNELKAIRTLLDVLVLDGCIVALDALGCQTDVAAAIVGRDGDYVLAVKDNQKGLSEVTGNQPAFLFMVPRSCAMASEADWRRRVASTIGA